MRLFAKSETRRSTVGRVAHAVAEGTPEERLLDQVVESLFKASRADRAGVWLEEPGIGSTLWGIVRDRNGNATPQEWARLAVDLPFLRPIYLRGRAHEPVLEAEQSETLIGPMLDMRRAAWVPVRQREHTFGVVFAATRHRDGAFSAAALEPVAAELAMALEAERERSARIERDADLEFARDTLDRILRGTPPAAVIQTVVENCVEQAGAEFAAVGSGRGSELGFGWKSGTVDWATLLRSEALRELWERALEERRVVGVDARGKEFELRAETGWPGRVTRVVTLPLEKAGQRVGVLVVGLRSSQDSLLVLERLELRAGLAAAALVAEAAQEEDQVRIARWRSWMAATSEAVLVLDKEGVVCEASRGALEMLSLGAKSFGRLHLEDLFAPATGAGVAIWSAAVVGGDPEALRLGAEGLLTDGRRVGLSAEPEERAGEGRWRVRLQPAAAPAEGLRAEAELHAVLEWLDQGVVLFDAQGWIRASNSRFAQVMGFEPGEVQSLMTLDALARRLAEQTADPDEFAQRWKKEITLGEAGARDEVHLLKPEPRVLERFGRPVFDPDGRRIGWLELYRDLTPQRLFQSKMLRTEKLAAVGQMVTGVAHELSNLLTSITGCTQHLLVCPTGAHVKDDLNRIFLEADRAGRMLRNVLLNARERKPERRPVNLNQIVERTIELRRYELELDHVRVDTHLDRDLPQIVGDPDQLQQVVTNLIVNAEQALQERRGRGTIRVRTSAEQGPRARLEISDDGPGIPAAILARIFDPFFTTKPAGAGTGLGLSIVHGIVREHGGEVFAENSPEGGARFVVELPGIAGDTRHAKGGTEAALPAIPEGVPDATEQVPVGTQSRQVLVVEDEPTVARLIADVLREEGHRVVTLLDSRAALERAGQGGFDLVICDLKMPGLDGQHFYESLVRAVSPLRQRIIFVTGDTLAPHALEFLEQNGLPYVAKPFRVEELKRAVERILNRARAQAASGGRASGGAEAKARKS